MNSIDFNHVSKNLSYEEVEKLKALYYEYHKLMWCYKKKYKRLKRIFLTINLTSISLTVVGTSLAPVTHYISLSAN